MSESQQGPEICDIISAKRYVMSLSYLHVACNILGTEYQICLPRIHHGQQELKWLESMNLEGEHPR